MLLILFLLICCSVIIGIGTWYYIKNKQIIPSPNAFPVSIINKTGITLAVKLPDGQTKTFVPDEIYPKTGTYLVNPGSTISYQVPADAANLPPTNIPYSFSINGTPSSPQTWFLTKGGVMKSSMTFRVTNDTNTQESCCSGGGQPNSVTFQPFIIWNENPMLTQQLPDILPGQSTAITHFWGGNAYVPIEFRYPNYNYNKSTGEKPYKVWKLEGINMKPNMNVSLLLNQYCNPLYPTDIRCDGSNPKAENQFYGNVPLVTIKLGKGVGSNTKGVNTPFAFKDFCITTDSVNNGITQTANNVLFCSASSPDPSTWIFPTSSIVNNKLYVGSAERGTDLNSLIYSKDKDGNIDHIPYTTCDNTTSYTLYVWGGNQSGTDRCKNPPTNRTCGVVGQGHYNCIGHLSSDAGNYKDPCNDGTSTGHCVKDSDCAKCWDPRFCNTTDFVTPRCDVLRSRTQKCTRDAMCTPGLKCNNGHCGTSPIGGACSKNNDCIESGGWCYQGRCIAKSSDGGPCDPSTASSNTCESGYCCKNTLNPPWLPGILKQQCPPAYDGKDKCGVMADRGSSVQLCRQCTDYMNIVEPPNPWSCPGNSFLALCGNGIPINTCSPSDYTFVEDSVYENSGLCMKCPPGYMMNPKYKVDGKWKCGFVSTSSNKQCPDMCIAAENSTGSTCVYNNTREPCNP